MPDTALSRCFTVTIDDVDLGTWTKCEGLSVEHEVFEYQEGGLNDYVHRLPGRRKYQNVKLTRPLDKDSANVVTWISGMVKKVKRSNAHIAVFDADGNRVVGWDLRHAWPVKWTGPTLDAAGNQVANEVLELAHDGFIGVG